MWGGNRWPHGNKYNDGLMNITHDHESLTERQELVRLRHQLSHAVRVLDELIKQKEWESNKTS